MTYQRINNLTGWGVFVVALIVYLLTVAPTASFWDCGEFIACSNELEVTHPPGAPLFLLLGRIFSMLSFGDVKSIAYMINLMSVLSGAFTALFTCWATTILAKRGLEKSGMSEPHRTIATMTAGVLAGLTCTFADSIWFNNVEAEVYAMSSFFTAIVVWMMLKWSEKANEPGSLRWLILIAYMVGLSTGVHLLNLLTIPALALIYYFEKYEFSWVGFGATMGISVAILASIQYGIIQYLFRLAWGFEKFFTGTMDKAGGDVAGLGLPIGTGFTTLLLLVIGGMIAALWWSVKERKVLLNTVLLCYTAVFIGFSSYSLIFIRSNVDPPVDMNNPENVLTFLSYMRREQYGDRPLFRGPRYNARPTSIKQGEMKYIMLDDKDRYVEDVQDQSYVYDDKDQVFFPRMYTADRYNKGRHGYVNYVSKKGGNPNDPYDDKPSNGDDLRFFLDYQVRHMYLRYFMWNFVGRRGDGQDANWESGLEWNRVDTNNKANNHYFFLPFLLGLLGVLWQYFNKRQDAAVIGMLFFFTGLAIVMYLNQYPAQPRERDYSYAGSFQTFCIWIGLGAIFLYDVFRSSLKQYTPYAVGFIALAVPSLMAFQNWDDHTRKGRNIDVEFAYNLLDSCAPNAILFTGGDNDTFPVWYAQEVEGYRTDVRVVNLELLISDWYIEQMQQPKNGALPVPITMDIKDYKGEKTILIYGFKSQKINLPVNKEALVANGTITEEEAAIADDVMVWDFKAKGSSRNPYILRKDSAMINILRNVAKDNWERPVYFASMMAPSSFNNLEDYFRLEGLAHRVIPVKKTATTANDIYYGRIGQDIMMENLLEKFSYTNLDNPDVYFDEHARNVIVGSSYRNAFFRMANSFLDQVDRMTQDNMRARIMIASEPDLADSLQAEIARRDVLIADKTEKSEAAIRFMEEKIPHTAVPKNMSLLITHAQLFDRSGMSELADRGYAEVEDVAMRSISNNKKLGIRHNPKSIPFQSILITIQYHVEKGTPESIAKANEIANEIELITGSKIGKQMIQQVQQRQNQSRQQP